MSGPTLRAPPLSVDIQDQRAFIDGNPIELGPKPFALLIALMQGAGKLVTKEELIENVWDGRFVSEAVLTTAMRDLRRALGDDAREPTYIATAHGRGYRFLKPVIAEGAGAPTPAPIALAATPPAPTPLTQRLAETPPPLAYALAALLAIFLIAAFGSVDWTERRAARLAFAAIDSASIAVLPFENLSANGEQSHFSDGLAEEILNVLMGVDGLKVASRTSSFAFADRDIALPQLARELGVRHVLEGSVRMSGDHVRVRVRLIDARADRTMWSRSYDRALSVENLFAIQEEIAERVVRELEQELEGELGPRDIAARSAAAGTTNLAAYEAYLRARELFLARSELDRAVGFAETSVGADPNFARGWEMLAAASFVASGGNATPRGREAIATALRLDPNLSLAHAVNGVMGNLEPPYNWNRVIGELERALELDPQNTTALLWLATELHKLGYLDRAQALLERCIQIDPAYNQCRRHFYWVLHMRGETDRALLEYGRLVRDGATVDETVLLFALLERNREAEARDLVGRLDAETPLPEIVFEAARNPAPNRLVARRVYRRWFQGVRFKRNVQALTLALGAYDLIDTRQGSNAGLWWPEFPEFRQSAAFENIVRRLGIDAYWREHGFPPQCRPVGVDSFACT